MPTDVDTMKIWLGMLQGALLSQRPVQVWFTPRSTTAGQCSSSVLYNFVLK